MCVIIERTQDRQVDNERDKEGKEKLCRISGTSSTQKERKGKRKKGTREKAQSGKAGVWWQVAKRWDKGRDFKGLQNLR
jgi:hypothetical protein